MMAKPVIVAGLLAASGLPAAAQVVEVSQACFPEFCIESREAFIRVRADATRARFVIKHFGSDRTIVFQKNADPYLVDCSGLCRLVAGENPPRGVHATTGEPMGRVFGPFKACAGEHSFYVVARVYLPMPELDRFEVVRHCR